METGVVSISGRRKSAGDVWQQDSQRDLGVSRRMLVVRAEGRWGRPKESHSTGRMHEAPVFSGPSGQG